MFYGIGFLVDEDCNIRCLTIITSKEEIKQTVDEIVKSTGNATTVRRVVTLPTENKVLSDEAKKIANKWWNNYSQMKIIDVLRGD